MRPSIGAATWSVDSAHTAVHFTVRNFLLKLRGRLGVTSGHVVLDQAAPERSSARAVLDVRSLTTGHPGRDAHVLSSDMLDAERFPHILFQSTAVQLETPTSGRVAGELEVRGVVRPIELDVQLLGRDQHPTIGAEVLGLSATTSVSRSDFGVTYNIPWGALDLIGDRVDITIDLQAVREPS